MPRALRIVALAVTVLVALAVVAELAGRRALESAATQRLRDGGVEGDIEVDLGRPLRPSLLAAVLTGELDRAEVRVRDARLSGVDVAEVDYLLERLRVTVSPGDRTVGATSLGAGSVRVLLDGADGAPTGAPLRPDPVGDRLRAAGSWYLPCDPVRSSTAGGVELTCSGTELPGVLVAPLGPGGTGPAPSSDLLPPPDPLPPPQTVELDPDG